MDDITKPEGCQEATERPGYYAVIPATVRYDDRLAANAKLLYGEISALVGKEGFCFASNEYFAQLYGCTGVSIARLMTALEKAGYIRRQMERDGSGQVLRRKIMLVLSAADGQPLNNIVNTPYQFCGEGGNKNVKENNTGINNKKENIKEKVSGKRSAPREKDFQPMPVFEEWIRNTFPDQTPEVKNGLYLALKRFMENRAAIKKPMKSKAAVTALCNKLMKLTGGDPEKMVELLDDATENGWQSIYKREDTPSGTQVDKGEYICL